MKKISSRIRLIVLIFMVIASLFIFLGIYGPITDRLKDQVRDNFRLMTYNKHQILHENLASARNNAASLSSRTEIRNMLASYTRGEIGFEELQDFTIPRYTEGASVFEDTRFIARVASDGRVVHLIGEDGNIQGMLNPQEREITSRYIEGEKAVLIQSPIVDGDDLVGFDLMLVDIQDVVEEVQRGGYELTFVPEYINEGTRSENGRIVSYIKCEILGGTARISRNESEIFKSVEDLTSRISIGYFLVISLSFFLVQSMVINYIKKFVLSQEELKNKAQDKEREKNLIIEEMNKGFVLLKGKEGFDGDPSSCLIVDTNKTFESMAEVRKEDIIGKALPDVLQMEQDWARDNLRQALRGNGSRQFEYYFERDKGWWLISAYKPQEGYLAVICEDITEKRNIEKRLRESENILRLTLDVAGVGLWDWNMDTGVLKHNRRWSRMLGYDDNLMTHRIDDFLEDIHPQDKERVLGLLQQSLEDGVAFFCEYRIIRKDGSLIWVEDRGALVGGPGSRRMIGSISDITGRKEAEQELLFEKEMFQSTLLAVGDGIISTYVNGEISVINPAAQKLTGWDRQESMGKDLFQVFDIMDPDSGKTLEDLTITKLDSILKGECRSRLDLRTKSGDMLYVEANLSQIKLKNGSVKGFVLVFRDVTEVVENQKRIEFLSFNDELTGLYNRRYLEDSLDRLDSNRNLPFTVMMIDLNNLKLANDIFGHEAGDGLIKNAAELLRQTFREDDVIARIGGDEFCVLLPKTPASVAESIRERIQESSKDYGIDLLDLSLAVGYGVKNLGTEDIRDIKREADEEMYKDKQMNSSKVNREIIEKFLEENYSKLESERDHNKNVARLSADLLRELGETEEYVEEFRRAVELHDIGKVVVPEEILNKEGPLTDIEFELMKRHPQVSYQILKVLDSHNAYTEGILYHHERLDGKGYPEGLKGEDLPLEARIVGIADAYDTMTRKMSYKGSMTSKEAEEELRRCAGTQFDSELVDLFVEKVLPRHRKETS